jgi:hypothetical protein
VDLVAGVLPTPDNPTGGKGLPLGPALLRGIRGLHIDVVLNRPIDQPHSPARRVGAQAGLVPDAARNFRTQAAEPPFNSG